MTEQINETKSDILPEPKNPEPQIEIEKYKRDLAYGKIIGHIKEQGEKEEREERIVCAAIHFDDGVEWGKYMTPKNINSGVVLCGLRHCRIINMAESLGILGKCETIKEGFITSLNRFVDRKDAAEIAYMAGQISKRVNYLTSEDLY